MKVRLPEPVIITVSRFRKAGFEIYVVGGAVRDLLMERRVTDWDFTTKAHPAQILELFPQGFYDNKFGTVGIKFPDGVYEVTTFRKEIGYSDRRHPDKIVWGETIKEDLSRRDFTINAMALRFAQGKPSPELIDPYNGQKDLKAKLVRAVGDPDQRFSEDALRLMRAVRIATELGFLIEKKTFAAVAKKATLINQIAAERVRDELMKILSSAYPADGYNLLRSSGLAEQILPEMEKTFAVPQQSPGRHHLYDVGTHSVLSLKHCPSLDPIVRLATLIHDIGKPVVFKKDQKTGLITFYNHEVIGASITANIAHRLKFSRRDQELLVTLIRWHQFSVDERQTDSAIRRFVRHVGKENVPAMLDLRVGDRLGGGARETSWRLEKFKQRLIEVQKQPFSVKDLKIGGQEVMKGLKIPPGPRVGQTLEALFKEVVSGRLANEKKALVSRLSTLR